MHQKSIYLRTQTFTASKLSGTLKMVSHIYLHDFVARIGVWTSTANGRPRGRPRKKPNEPVGDTEKTPRRLRSRSHQTVWRNLDDDNEPLSRYPSLTPQSPTKQPNEKHASYFTLVAKALVVYIIFQHRPVHKQVKPISTMQSSEKKPNKAPLGTTGMKAVDTTDPGSKRPDHQPKRQHKTHSIPLGPSSIIPEAQDHIEEPMADAQVSQPQVPGSLKSQVDDADKMRRMATSSITSKVNWCWSYHHICM